MRSLAASRRALAASLAATTLLLASVAPAWAGDDLVVQRGDTLWDIARRYGTTVAELVALNGIANPSLIRVGQRIVLQAPEPTPSAPATPPPAAPQPIVHVVRSGDSVWALAREYGTTIAAIVQANHLASASFIRTGQALLIPQSAPAGSTGQPGPASTAAAAAAPAPRVHVVEHGDTLWDIARQYGTTVAALSTANLLANPSFLRVGQRLVIPGASPTPAAPATPASVTNPSMPPAMAAKVAARTAARDLLLAAASEFSVSAAFVLAVAWHESGWQPAVVSSAGAVGLMQLMPATADWVAGSMLHEAPNIADARWNARAGARLLSFYLARYGGDKAKALAAYFQGMTSVDQRGILQSTRPYIEDVLALEAIFSR